MKKLLGIVVIGLLWCNVGFSKTIDQRLDDIEKRLENIEKSLKALDFINNLTNNSSTSTTSSSKSKSKTNTSKINFELTEIGCVKEDYSTKLKIYYRLENNYEKSIKLIDANFTIKNLFDEKLFAAKILRSAYVEPERIKDFAAVMDKTFDIDDSCGKLEQSDIEDYKIDFSVDKIAFEDNSIINFK